MRGSFAGVSFLSLIESICKFSFLPFSGYYPCGAHFEGENAGFTGVQIPAVGDDPLVVNTGSNTFARVWYDDYTFNRLLDGLKNGDFQLTDETLIRMINDELAIVHRNERLDQPASYLRSLKLTAVALNNTDSAAVFGTAMKLIDEMVRLGVDMNERELFEVLFCLVFKVVIKRRNISVLFPNNFNSILPKDFMGRCWNWLEWKVSTFF